MKGDKYNKETAYAGLNFNIKETKRWLAKFFKTNYNKDYVENLKKKRLEKRAKDNKDTDIDEERLTRTNIKNAHFALGFVEEMLCIKLIDAASVNAKKSKVKSYTINEDDFINVILMDNDLKYTFSKHLNLYNKDEDYENTMKLTKKIIYKFIDVKSSMGISVLLEQHAVNFLLFILHQNRIMLATSAYNKMMYSKKSSVDFRGIMYSIFDHYNGKLRDLIYKKVDSKIKLFENKVSSDDDDDEENKENNNKHTDNSDSESDTDTDSDSSSDEEDEE